MVTTAIRNKARQAVQRAVERGEIAPVLTRVCEFCGRPADVYHHDSYDREEWLNVNPLCGACHKILHKHGIGDVPHRRIEIIERCIWGCEREMKGGKNTFLERVIQNMKSDIECLQVHF